MAICERSIASVVMKNERQRLPAISLSRLQTPCVQRIRVAQNLTNQIVPGRVTINRSISDSGCVAYIERELTIAIISTPGIFASLDIYFCPRCIRATSCSLGSVLTHIIESNACLYCSIFLFGELSDGLDGTDFDSSTRVYISHDSLNSILVIAHRYQRRYEEDIALILDFTSWSC